MTDRPRGVFHPAVATFMREVLDRTADLRELKAVLLVALLTSELDRPSIDLEELSRPDVARGVVGWGSPEPNEQLLRRALDRAVVNGSLLRLTRRIDGHDRVHYLLATDENRALLTGLASGDQHAARVLHIEGNEGVDIYRPNIFAYYERNIGPLTPLLADELRDAERSYPREWIEAAMQEAALYDRRTWRYVQSILLRWETEGAPTQLKERGVS